MIHSNKFMEIFYISNNVNFNCSDIKKVGSIWKKPGHFEKNGANKKKLGQSELGQIYPHRKVSGKWLFNSNQKSGHK